VSNAAALLEYAAYAPQAGRGGSCAYGAHRKRLSGKERAGIFEPQTLFGSIRYLVTAEGNKSCLHEDY
jgi:hypothetical protein